MNCHAAVTAGTNCDSYCGQLTSECLSAVSNDALCSSAVIRRSVLRPFAYSGRVGTSSGRPGDLIVTFVARVSET